MKCTFLYTRHSFPRLRRAACAAAPPPNPTYEPDIWKDRSTGTAVRPGRRAGTHRSVALDGPQEMPLLIRAPIEGYLRTDRPHTWRKRNDSLIMTLSNKIFYFIVFRN